jgi:hypothetical protein
MSRTKPHDLDEIALSVPCPFCGAQPDEWCTTKSGEWSSWLHSRRSTPIRDAWGLGYQEYEHYLSLAVRRGEVEVTGDNYWSRTITRHHCAICPERAS